jgi:hypothetical protein
MQPVWQFLQLDRRYDDIESPGVFEMLCSSEKTSNVYYHHLELTPSRIARLWANEI